ncbi:MAG: hypothetical protein LAQ30_05800 [Acidobacteriia bacterium]|nr:hypothetical protein [Terriglobia bacterium]
MFARYAIQRRPFGRFLTLLPATLLLASTALCQQTIINRFDAFSGFTYLNSPHIGLSEQGAHLQTGYRPMTWLSLGIDYSFATGTVTLTPDMLLSSLQQSLGQQLAVLVKLGVLPSAYKVAVPTHSQTQTFAAGPQVSYHHFQHLTLFARPSAGFMREMATPHPTDAITKSIIAQLEPSGRKLDWVKFYGFGAGVDLFPQKPVALRVQFDLVRDHLFNDLLKDARNTVRISIGPAFNFGKNIVD